MTTKVIVTEIREGNDIYGYRLVAEDGYATSRKMYLPTEYTKAQKAAERETRLNEAGKSSRMVWDY